ncbi:MAG: type IV secretory system conjugative DNA transfer family protein [Acutalibacteraceae bacterium]
MKSNVNNNNRIIAKGIFVSNDTRKTGLNNNDLIIGPSGAGKTGGYVIPNMLMGNSSMIVADTKCCLYNNYKSRLENMGYKCRVLDFVNPKKFRRI